MLSIKLNDILHLTEEQISNAKIALCMQYGGETFLSKWYESDPKDRKVDFVYHSHYGNRRNFQKDEWCFGFVRLEENPDRWLLVTAGKIIDVPQTEGTCRYAELEQFQGLVGRLILN